MAISGSKSQNSSSKESIVKITDMRQKCRKPEGPDPQTGVLTKETPSSAELSM